MNRVNVFRKSTNILENSKRNVRFKDILIILLIMGTVLGGLALASQVASGNWLIAAMVVFAVPAFIALVRFPFISLIIWVVLSPFLVQTPTTAERTVYWLIHRLLPVLTLGVMIISSTMRISTRRLPRFGPAEYAMLGYVALTVLSVITQNSDISGTLILFYDRVFIPMCLYWLVKLSAPGEKTLKWLVPVAIYITVTQVAIGSISWVMPSILPSSWVKYAGARTTGSLNSVSVYTTTLIFAGMFLLYAALRAKPGWKRNFLVLAFISILYAVLISFSRASWLAGVLVLLGIFILYPRFTFRLMLKLLPVILLLGGTLLVNQFQHAAQERLYSQDSAQTALSRLPVLVAAYRMYEAKPVFGWGYANFDRYDRQFQGRFGNLVNPDEKDHSSHNMYLTLMAEQGIIGLGLILTPVLWLLYRTFKIRSHLPRSGLKGRNMTYLLWLVVLSYIVVMNFAPIVVVFGLGLYWITLGLISNNVQPSSVVLK